MIRILTGDCRDVLPTLDAGSVHCVVCSPPYYGLRDYGTAQWDGGDADCQHVFPRQDERLMLGSNGTLGKNCTSWTHRDATPPRQCSCGARRIDRQLGLEATPDEYIQTMVEVFREVRRVLRPDGTCWVNMGDSYANGGGEKRDGGHGFVDGGKAKLSAAKGALLSGRWSDPVMKPKDLMMMPARLALALQADGWWLRSDIIWAKPNPMPESVTDRPTSAHEHIFLLTKRSRYYYDADAVREPVSDTPGAASWRRIFDPAKQTKETALKELGIKGGNDGASHHPESGRNLRNVWTITTAPFSAAHFATFPPELAERCIKAGTSERGCCAQCGKPWVRVTERSVAFTSGSGKSGNVPNGKHAGTEQALSGDYDIRMGPSVATTTTGWQPGCRCNADTKPCVVLDPFSGAGTSGLVADRLGRDAVMIDLNHQYVEMARERLQADCPLFADITDAPVASEDAYDRDMRDLFAEVAD